LTDPAPPGRTSPPETGVRALILLVVTLGVLRLLFPGDVPFINDEPRIVAAALDANQAGVPASVGLRGTRGAPYGPVPTWIYQGALAFTSDLRVVVVLRALLVTGLTGWALVLLSRALPGVVPALGAFALLSPYLWLYARDLWDNSFAVPFSAMCLAAYARYLVSERIRWLAGSAAFGVACLLTHLMTVPVIAAVALHFVLTRWREMLRGPSFAAVVGGIAAAAVLVSAPYLREVMSSEGVGFALSPYAPALAFGIGGFRTFSLVGFDYVIGAWPVAGLAPWLVGFSALVFPAGAYGAFLVLRRAQEADSSPGRELSRVLLYTLLVFVLLANGQRLVEHPHYYSGVWAVFFCLWWVGMSRLMERTWARRLFFLQATVMVLFLSGLAGWLHANGGTRSLRYGPTLGNQMLVAQQLDRLGAEPGPPSLAFHPGAFPQAIQVLRRLNRLAGGEVADRAAPAGSFRLEYEDPGGAGGAIVVRATTR